MTCHDRSSEAVFLRVLLPRGENDSHLGLGGLCELTAEWMTKGAGTRNADEIAETLDRIGANLVVDCDAEYTILGCNALAGDFDLVTEILRDIVMRPRLEDREFHLLKDQEIAGLKARRSSPPYLAAIHLPPAVFGPGTLQGNVKTERSVRALRPADAREMHPQMLNGRGTIAMCSGAVDPTAAMDKLAEMFREIPTGFIHPLQTDIPLNHRIGDVILVVRNHLTQTSILMGKPMSGRLAADYRATQIANYILGGGGLVSRLMQAVRARDGRTYGIRSCVPSSASADLFNVQFTCRNEQLDSGLQTALDVMDSLAADGPTEIEVDEAKEFHKGFFFLQTETLQQRARCVIDSTFYGRSIAELERYPQRIDAITPDAVRATAKKHFSSDHLTFCLVGPEDVIRGAEEKLAARTRHSAAAK